MQSGALRFFSLLTRACRDITFSVPRNRGPSLDLGEDMDYDLALVDNDGLGSDLGAGQPSPRPDDGDAAVTSRLPEAPSEEALAPVLFLWTGEGADGSPPSQTRNVKSAILFSNGGRGAHLGTNSVLEPPPLQSS